MGLRVKFKFKTSHKDKIRPINKSEFRPMSIFWNVTYKCFFDCIFCDYSAGEPRKNELNSKECLTVIDKMIDSGVSIPVISGGEPLLRKDIDKILDGMEDFERVKFCTNGYYLKKYFDLINDRTTTVQLSLNSTNKEIYYKMSSSAPNDAFDKAMEAVDLLKDYSGHSVVSTVPLRVNRKILPEMMDFCREKGIETFSLYKLIPQGRATGIREEILSEGEFIQIIDDLFERFVDYGDGWLVEVEQPYGKSSQVVKKWEKKITFNFSGCRAGRLFASLTPDGYITPCPALDQPEFYAGNIRDTSILDAWGEEPFQYFRDHSDVKKNCYCEDYDYCRGGCRVIANIFESIASKDPYCEAWKNELV